MYVYMILCIYKTKVKNKNKKGTKLLTCGQQLVEEAAESAT